MLQSQLTMVFEDLEAAHAEITVLADTLGEKDHEIRTRGVCSVDG